MLPMRQPPTSDATRSTSRPQTAGWRAGFGGWRTAAGAATGVAFGSTPFFSAAWALLGASWADAFGWSARELATGATLFLATQTVAFRIHPVSTA